MKNNFKIVVALVLWLCLAVSCKRTNDALGPETVLASQNFKVLDSLKTTNLKTKTNADSVVFRANFSERVTWVIDITSKISSAKFSVTGLDSVIDIVWEGNSESTFQFKKGEIVSAVISVFGSDYKDTIDITLLGSKPPRVALLISDYDGGSDIEKGNWWNTFKPKELIGFSDRYNQIQVPQGKNCLHMEGIDVGPDGFLGLTGHNGAFDYKSFVADSLPNDPSRLFVNFYLQGNRGSSVEIRMIQTVPKEKIEFIGKDTIRSFPLSLDGDDFSYFVDINWDGWRLISVPYSDFNRTGGTNDRPVKKPSDITRTKVVLRAVVNGEKAMINLDYLALTVDKPLAL
jgi:hypothetical protein